MVRELQDVLRIEKGLQMKNVNVIYKFPSIYLGKNVK